MGDAMEENASNHKSQAETSKSWKSRAGEIVWAKAKGYSPWPSILVRDDELTLVAEKERSAHNSKFIPVFFLGSYNYGFCLPENIYEFKKNLPKFSKDPQSKREGGFDTAIQEALDHERAMEKLSEVLEHDRAERERKKKRKEAQPQRRRTADVASPTPRKKLLQKRSTMGMDVDEEDAKPTVKRSRSLDKDDMEDEDVERQRRLKESRSKKEGKEKRFVSSQTHTPMQKLFYLRHKIQKIMMKTEEPITDAEYEKVDNYLKDVEEFDVTIPLLQETKIGKLMRRVLQVNIPQEVEDKYRIKKRSEDLTLKWKQLLVESGVAGNENGAPVVAVAAAPVPASTPLDTDPVVAEADITTVQPASPVATVTVQGLAEVSFPQPEQPLELVEPPHQPEQPVQPSTEQAPTAMEQ